ncbi:hypothetical protein ACE6H2_006229 [Prunus campanulata]
MLSNPLLNGRGHALTTRSSPATTPFPNLIYGSAKTHDPGPHELTPKPLEPAEGLAHQALPQVTIRGNVKSPTLEDYKRWRLPLTYKRRLLSSWKGIRSDPILSQAGLPLQDSPTSLAFGSWVSGLGDLTLRLQIPSFVP